MEGDYPQQLINSERGLQHFFCKHLQCLFSEAEVDRRLFIEPRLSAQGGAIYSPDLMLCNTRRIIGVVEFKFAPRGRASAEKDLLTLTRIQSHSEGLELSNDRYRGIGDGAAKRYSLASDAILCWAGVYATSNVREKASSIASGAGRRFLGLHAITSEGEAPDLAYA